MMTYCAVKPLASERNGMLDGVAQAHCKRVAAWCEELALALAIPCSDASALEEAALMHHHPLAFLSAGSPAENRDDSVPRLLSVEAEQVLAAFRARASVSAGPKLREVVRILDIANAFDEQLELGAFENGRLAKVLQAEETPGESHPAIQSVLKYLRKASISDLNQIIPKLPVYPAVAMKLYNLLSNDDVNLKALDSVVKSDPVLTGKILQAANSAYYSPRQPIRTVSQSIGYIGLNDARRILLASSIQPMYASPRHERIWKHSLEAAQIAERLAQMSGKVDPSEAFLVGLLHDVGKLAISRLSPALNSSLDRLMIKGCESAVAEVVVCGFDHAEAGSKVLSHWQFGSEIVAAVQNHHAPERNPSPMASILYLTEYWTDSEEDIPSNSRLDLAFEVTGLSLEKLQKASFEMNEALCSC